MKEIKIFENVAFGPIRIVEVKNEPWFVGKDVAEVLGYSNTMKAIRDHVKDNHKLAERIVLSGQNREAILIDEAGVYSLVMRSKLPKAEQFQEWVTSEVLPAIRKTGGYINGSESMSDDEIMARALNIANNTINNLKLENSMQKQMIAEFKPVKEYVDTILSSTDTVTVTQIAADYGLSAKALNKILFEEGLVHNVNKQWILYKKHMNRGYTKSETIDVKRADGSVKVVMNTKWTQKGRLKIHEILTAIGIVAEMDRDRK